MSGERPACGDQIGEAPVGSKAGLFAFLGFIIGAGGIGMWVYGAVSAAGAFTLLGMTAIGLAGVGGTLLVLAAAGYMWYDRCWPRRGGIFCWAGVVNAITPSFDSGWDVVWPSGAMHPRVDVVVKSRFWHLVEDGAATIACSPSPAGIGSPMILSFYKSAAVCAAAAGAAVGAGIAVAVAVAVAVAIAAAGCATIIFCIFALLLAAVVGIALALGGAAAGGAIGRALAGDDAPSATGGGEIAVGHLVTVNGRLITMAEFDGANVAWWAQGTTVHGATDKLPPYSDVEAAELLTDSCPIRDVPPAPPPAPPAPPAPPPPPIG